MTADAWVAAAYGALVAGLLAATPRPWARYLKDLDVDFIRSVDNNFNRLARRFIDS